MQVEGAAAGYYVAALFESARPGHRGLNTAALIRDARSRSAAALGRLRIAHHFVRAVVSPGPGRAPARLRFGRPASRSRARVRGKPRRRSAA